MGGGWVFRFSGSGRVRVTIHNQQQTRGRGEEDARAHHHLNRVIFLWEISRVLLESILGDSMKDILCKAISLVVGCLGCRKRAAKTEHKAEAFFVEQMRKDSRAHLYSSCESLRRSKGKIRAHSICDHCLRQYRREGVCWDAEER